MGSGQCPVKRYNRQLRNLIHVGKAKPSWLVSHQLPLTSAPDAYEHFDRRDTGWTKVVLSPAETNGASGREAGAARVSAHPVGVTMSLTERTGLSPRDSLHMTETGRLWSLRACGGPE